MPSSTTPQSALTTTTNTPSGSSLWPRSMASPMCVSELCLISFPCKLPMPATTLTLPSSSPTKRMCALKSDLSTCIWSTNPKIELITRWTGRRTTAFKDQKTRLCMQERMPRCTRPPSTWPTSSTSNGSSRRPSQPSNAWSCCTHFLSQINWSKHTLESNRTPSQTTLTSLLALLPSSSNTCLLRTPHHSTAKST